MASPRRGDAVTIIGGSYQGETGHFVRWPYSLRRRSAHVHLTCHNHPDETSCLRLENISFNAAGFNQQHNQPEDRAPMANAIVIDDNDNHIINNNNNINNLVTTEMLQEQLRLIAELFSQLVISNAAVTARVDALENINNALTARVYLLENNSNGTTNSNYRRTAVIANEGVVVDDDDM
jgi:hypothetical protein